MQFSSRLRQRTDALCRALVKRKRFHTVMAGHSRLKDGVACARLCPGHPRLATRHEERGSPGHDDVLVSRRSKRTKLLRGQGLPDMWDLPGKVAENCEESSLETL
jgi:hypothetical protein